MNTKILLGTAVARGFEHAPLMLDMAAIGKLLVCADSDGECVSVIRHIVRGFYVDTEGHLNTDNHLAFRAGSTLWRVCASEDGMGDGFRIIDAGNPDSIEAFLDDLAEEYDRRSSNAAIRRSNPGLQNDDDALFVVIEDLATIIKVIGWYDTMSLLRSFSLGKSGAYPAHGMFLIAGIDIGILARLCDQRLQLYNCHDRFNIMMFCGRLSDDQRRVVTDFFGERVGDMIADGTPAPNIGWLVDFENPPTPVMYQPKGTLEKTREAVRKQGK